jgi:dTDP-4-amino-4,6-dideoxygalactose transaminase
MDRIADWAKEKGLVLLEDAAHAQGASMQGRMMGTWGVMGIFSFQTSKVLPAVEGGMGMYQTREYYERAAAFAEYTDPEKFPEPSPLRVYAGSGLGQKYRMHPLAAALARQQLQKLPEMNALARKNVRAMNQHLTQLPGIVEPRQRDDQQRVYYNGNMLFIDFNRLGCSRDALKAYAEAKWWHHPPQIPESMPGNAWVNANHIFLPVFYREAPELTEQYVKAFQKVWAHRTELARL